MAPCSFDPMKKKSTSTSAPAPRSVGEAGFFNLRVLIGLVVALAGIFIALGGMGLYLGPSKAQAQPGPGPTVVTTSSPSSGPDVVPLVGPVRVETDLRDLPYIPPAPHILKKPLSPRPWPKTAVPSTATSHFAQFQALITGILRPVPTMPAPLLTFDGISFADGEWWPPDTNRDVGPNHYVQSVNDSYQVFDKNGNPLTEPITFNSFFLPLKDTPCGAGDQNHGDPFVFYDQLADRWVITDFAYPSHPGTSFWECIGVSQTGNPVTGGWYLYALEDDPMNPDRLGDYPKFGLWPDAYYLTMNEFPEEGTLVGVRVYALDRASMIGGTRTIAVGFTIDPTDLGPSFSLVPASFRTGAPPPAGRQELLLSIDAAVGEPQTHVNGWLFHVDFINPNISTLGLGSDHSPNAQITVSPYIVAVTADEDLYIVPQQDTKTKLSTQGDKMMTPLVYQNRNGTESLWADHTIILNYPDGPTAIRWYQFNVTGGNFPATPVQQQDWSNGNDGLWRWMPSIAVDQNGNTAIGYSTSSPSIFPSIRYAGRLESDPPGNLAQGEAIMYAGTGSQTVCEGEPCQKWGDYTMTTIDPSDSISFWHTNEYYVTTGNEWSTRVGKFQFSSQPSPTPRHSPTREPRPKPEPRP